jgi:alkylation response protein AidB-like acyl-CoA dehydrogenase
MADAGYVKGGEFLVRKVAPNDIFVREDFDNEQNMLAKTANDFIDNEALPNSDEIEAKNLEVSRNLLGKAGELGLMMGDTPEDFGGLGLDKTSCALIAESFTGQGSLQAMFMAHTGIGTLPIVYYGTDAQKEKYLPGLASGELMGAYCLTEPSAGSDAMSARTKAVLNEEGTHYVLNGTKQFITNGGIADVFTVFAKIDGEKFTGFIIEKGTPGLSIGPEEHKMGIKGSTTTTVIMEDCQVPVENLLGEIGQGHKIAFNILNVGRYKLGFICLGSAKRALSETLTYTLERKQFNTAIANFGAIREKLAEMYARIYALDATAYRTVGMIDALLESSGDKYGEAALDSIEEYNAECALVKVLGSETNNFVSDEGIQALGGYGFCAEYPLERFYRDNRVNRIFEGTNEINRIVIGSMLFRKAAAGKLPLFEAAKDAATPAAAVEGVLGAEQTIAENLKKVTLMVLGIAAQKYGKKIAQNQPVLLRIADMVIQSYAAESAVLRALKDVANRGEETAALPLAAARITCEGAVDTVESIARQCLVTMGETDALAALSNLVKRDYTDTIANRETIAAKLVEMERVVL